MFEYASLMGFVPTTDRARARAFYVDSLKLQFVSDDQFALVVKSGESVIRIATVPKLTPAEYTILGWEVSDIVATAKGLTAAGVSFLRYSFFEQDSLGIWTAPGGTRVAWFHDPDGNVLSISQQQ
jgi:catechol 2,3-dioxygenase-like lactoylglutathione lyase family enzyme